MSEGAAAPAASTPAGSRRVVARNTVIMMAAQVLGMPLSMAVSAVMGRLLGAAPYGQFYILTTAASVAFLFVDWGHGAVVPARIANDRAGAGRYLGSSLAWKGLTSLLGTGILVGIFALWGQPAPFLISLALVCLGMALNLSWRTCADVVRGFERTDVAAYAQIAAQVLTAALAIPTLWLGGKLDAYLVACAVAAAIVLLFALRTLRPAGVGALAADLPTARVLFEHGRSFLVLNLVLLLQPTIDAFFLERMASQEAIGWQAAARKLIGPLIIPAGSLISALYPTQCRLWNEDRAEYMTTARGAIRASIVLTVPLALGCALFAELGIALFSKQRFGPAEDNLRVLAAYVALVYITMVLGTCLNAAGRQRAWTAVQVLCVVVASVADPILIRYYQHTTGNGGMGVSISTVIAELIMLVAGILLMPRGTVDRRLLRSALVALVAGGAMAGVAWVTGRLGPFVAAPLSLVAYAGVLYALGGVEPSQVAMLRSFIDRRRRRAG